MAALMLKFLAVWMYLILLLGIPLLIGLLDFEKHGQDPLKRNLNDMVTTLFLDNQVEKLPTEFVSALLVGCQSGDF